MAPELSLLLRVGFSAAVVNMSNKMLSSAAPGFGDVMKQSPELMRMFTNAAVDTMSKQNTAFDFAKTMLNPPEQVNTKFGPPPAAMETKNMAGPQNRGGNMPAGAGMSFTPAPGNRPDLAAATRGIPMNNQTASSSNGPAMFRESGVDLNNGQMDYQKQEKSMLRPPVSQFTNNAPPPPMSSGPAQFSVNEPRPEMRGPQMDSNIDSILSGLKLKPSGNKSSFLQEEININDDDESVISLLSVKDMANSNLPKKTKKRQNRSDKNTVSLDI
jgi:hypothetical protein